MYQRYLINIFTVSSWPGRLALHVPDIHPALVVEEDHIPAVQGYQHSHSPASRTATQSDQNR